jgi:hypothetical protein
VGVKFYLKHCGDISRAIPSFSFRVRQSYGISAHGVRTRKLYDEAKKLYFQFASLSEKAGEKT